jgi:5'(3')-deoxyribonucleotidase
MNKLLYFDVDNTICNSTKRFVQIYNREYNENANWQDCYLWDYSDICPKLKDSEVIFSREDFYNHEMDFKDKYIDTIIKLLYLKNYDINFVTIGSKENLKYKSNWLKHNFPYIRQSNYHMLEKLSMGKEEIHMQNGILIDDNYINLLTSNADLKICMHKKVEWNKGVEQSGFIRLKNSLELYDFITQLERDELIG